MFISADQILAHGIGDYLIQSQWMANNKRSNSWACFCHALMYGLPFLILTQRPVGLIFIIGTHFLIDRFGLARYVVYVKNFIAPPSETFNINVNDPRLSDGDEYWGIQSAYQWQNCKATGYPSEVPAWLSVWLLIIADNLLHLILNGIAIKFL